MSSFTFALNTIKFEDVRQQVINFLKENSEYSSTFDWTGSNMAYIIDTMAYVSMMMAYHVTNISNNNFLDTTSLRKNAVSIAKTMGYRPKRIRSSMIYGKLTYLDLNQTFDNYSYIKLYEKNTFVTSNGYTFNNILPIELRVDENNPHALVGSFVLYEGKYRTHTVLGTGIPYQSFVIPSQNVEESNIELYVQKTLIDKAPQVKWEEVRNSFQIINRKVFFVEEDVAKEGFPKISFGDGIIGEYPLNDETIIVKYLETVGAEADGGYIVSLPEFLPATYETSHDITLDTTKFINWYQPQNISFGGKSLETLDEVKYNAPKYFATAGRAVTKWDYIAMLNSYNFIYKSNVIGGEELFPGEQLKLGHIYVTAMPYLQKTDFLKNIKIYLTPAEETRLAYELGKVNIISTALEFQKPSYLYINIATAIETSSKISVFDEVETEALVRSNLNDFAAANYDKFDSIFRLSKLHSEIDSLPTVISSDITIDYNFAINYDSFYSLNNADNNIIYLPVMVKNRNFLGDISLYTNFIKTNVEQAKLLGYNTAAEVPIQDRTIYGKLYHKNVDRYMYSEDNTTTYVDSFGNTVELTYTTDIKLYGTTKLFSFYRVAYDLASPIGINDSVKSIYGVDGTQVAVEITPFIDNSNFNLDSYKLKINGNDVGTMKRNNNIDYFLGYLEGEGDITAYPTNGQFYEVIQSFATTANPYAYAFESVTAGDYIIYDDVNYPPLWRKTNFIKNISAVNDSGLYTINSANDILSIGGSGEIGTFSGILTEPVSSGDYIIFNINSVTNPTHKWEKLQQHFTVYGDLGLIATEPLPKETSNYSVRLVQGLYDLEFTNFNGQTNLFQNNDLLFYDSFITNDVDKWYKLINVASSAEMAAVTGISAADDSGLVSLDYDPVSGVQPGAMLKVTEIGDFAFSTHILWRSTNSLDKIAYLDDLLIYVGDEQWVLFSRSYSNDFAINARVNSALPLNISYGYMFNVSGSGNFDGYFNSQLIPGDKVVYLGNNTWKKLVSLGTTHPSDITTLPTVANVGDVMKVIDDGNFGNSALLKIIEQYNDGDYMVFVGDGWVKLREYSFFYYVNPQGQDVGKLIMNTLGFNTTFSYSLNLGTRFFDIFFNDKFHDCTIGSFRYSVAPADENTQLRHDIGKLFFEKRIIGKYSSSSNVPEQPLKNIFNNYDDSHPIDIIRILPKNKVDDVTGELTTDPESDFDTRFNQYISLKIDNITKK